MKSVLFLLIIIGVAQAKLGDEARKNESSLPHNSVGKICYEGTVTLDSTLNKKMLFTSARSWLVSAFVSSKAVIEYEDKSAGKIMGKGFFLLGYPGDDKYNRVEFSLTIQVKDGRYRYWISEYNMWAGPVEDVSRGNYKWMPALYVDIDSVSKSLIQSLEKSMRATISDNAW
jgi:hypothetical protein